MEKEEITAKVYSLKTEKGGWLGEVVLTSDGMFAAVTDWGNFSYAWRAYGKDDSFQDFILSLNVEYFADKMEEGLSYIVHTMHSQKACHKFAEKILPALQEAIIERRKKEVWVTNVCGHRELPPEPFEVGIKGHKQYFCCEKGFKQSLEDFRSHLIGKGE
jgi:hypothetical protein